VRNAASEVRILFVCLGNICRSPTAEGVMRGLVADAGLDGEIEVESAGTAGYHVGDPPDPRSVAAAADRGVTLDSRARQVDEADFNGFDLLVAMDRSNYEELRALAPDDGAAARVRMLREFDPEVDDLGRTADVPDPYYGGPGGFQEVLDIVERSCAALLEEIRSERVP
jgi:protein-tyrosine phosphatase